MEALLQQNNLTKKRDSNIELLRIISMLLVLMRHACYLSVGTPTKMEIAASFGNSFMKAICESSTDICVNVFILISGWFGIKARWSRLAELVFQVLFISLTVYVVMRSLGLTSSMTADGWIKWLLVKNNVYWFVRAYLILYIFAPALNAFVDHYEKHQLRQFLLAFFFFLFIYGFYDSEGWYAGGYSPLLFMGLYVLARYMRLYPGRFMQHDKILYLLLYVIVTILAALGSLALTYFVGKGETVLFLYSSPFILFNSVCFFLFFTKISFYNRWVNWISISSFAAYLVHCAPWVFHPYYVDLIGYWSKSDTSMMFLLHTSGLIAFIFVFAILLDKIRMMVWNLLTHKGRSNT